MFDFFIFNQYTLNPGIVTKSVGQQDNLTEAILENNEGGRNARRASSSKVHDLTEDTNKENSDHNESKRQRIEMENFNGLQQWNTESDRIRELVNLEKEMGDPDNLVNKYQRELRAHLMKPYVKVVFARSGATPGSANIIAAPCVTAPIEQQPSSPPHSQPPSPHMDWNGESNIDFD